MVLWHWCWGNWKDWILIFIVLTGLHLWTIWVQIKQCCQELQQLLSKESSLLLVDSNVAWEVTQCHPKDFHVSALFVMDRKRQSLGKVYSVHMNSGKKKTKQKDPALLSHQRTEGPESPLLCLSSATNPYTHLQLKCSMIPCHSCGEETQGPLLSCPPAFSAER